MAGCNCPVCMGFGWMGGMGGGMLPIIMMPGMGGMGGMMGSCGDPMCPFCGGGSGGIPPCGIPGCTGECLQQCGCPECQASRGGSGGMKGMPPNITFPGGEGGGTMPTITWPGSGGGGGMPGMPGPDYGGGGGGGYPQPPADPGNSGEQTPAPTGSGMSAEPKLICRGTTGLPINCVIDTGLQYTAQMTPSGYAKHFGSEPVDRSATMSALGVSGAATPMAGRFLMKLALDFGNEQIMVEGNCWIYPSDNMTELLIGMPLLKKNKMHMRFDPSGDSIEIRGRRIPLQMKKTMFRKTYPPGEPFYEGSGKPQYKLGGGPDIVPQAARLVAPHHVPTHARHILHTPHRHHPAAKEREAVEEVLDSTDSGNEDEALQMVLAESVKNMSLNRVTNAAAPPLKNMHSKRKEDGGRSVEDMARIISSRAVEKSRKETQRRNEEVSSVDEELDRAIAMSLEGFD